MTPLAREQVAYQQALEARRSLADSLLQGDLDLLETVDVDLEKAREALGFEWFMAWVEHR